jgi:hypothetical protein
MFAEELREKMHAEVVAKYPNGLTPKQFRYLTLSRTDEDGCVEVPSIQDWWAAQSMIMGMCIEGLITRKCRRDEKGPYYITDKGREALRSLDEQSASPGARE